MSIEFLRDSKETLLAVHVEYIHDPDHYDDVYRTYFFQAEIIVRGAIRTKYFMEKQEAVDWVNEQIPKMLAKYDVAEKVE